jgi:hypothetical protein
MRRRTAGGSPVHEQCLGAADDYDNDYDNDNDNDIETVSGFAYWCIEGRALTQLPPRGAPPASPDSRYAEKVSMLSGCRLKGAQSSTIA